LYGEDKIDVFVSDFNNIGLSYDAKALGVNKCTTFNEWLEDFHK